MSENLHLSFEFFPPKSDEAAQHLVELAQTLQSEYQPDLFTVTFGAGGSTRTKTLETVQLIKDQTHCAVAAHLSCIGFSRKEMLEQLNIFQKQGLTHLVVLRGDIPSGMMDIGDFHYASDLVEFIRKETKDYFNIAVGAYPEYHPQALDPEHDVLNFVNKVKKGCNLAFTQYFFNPDAYFYFIEACQRHQVDVPIIPGIMPITNYKQIARFSDSCGAEIPRWIRQRLAYYDSKEDKESIEAFGTEVVSYLAETLIENGAPGLHFYTMNKLEPTQKILHHLGKLA